VLILAGRWLDLYLAVMPEVMLRPSVHALDVLIALGCLAGSFLLTVRALGGAPLVPRNNPSFHRSLAHHP